MKRPIQSAHGRRCVHGSVADAINGSAINGDASGPYYRVLHTEGRGGALWFYLQRLAGGLYVEREEVPRHGLQTMQSVQFTDADQFRQWCNDDPVRFEHPWLHDRLRHAGDELWRTAVQHEHGGPGNSEAC